MCLREGKELRDTSDERSHRRRRRAHRIALKPPENVARNRPKRQSIAELQVRRIRSIKLADERVQDIAVLVLRDEDRD